MGTLIRRVCDLVGYDKYINVDKMSYLSDRGRFLERLEIICV